MLLPQPWYRLKSAFCALNMITICKTHLHANLLILFTAACHSLNEHAKCLAEVKAYKEDGRWLYQQIVDLIAAVSLH